MKQPGEQPNRPARACVHHWICGEQHSSVVHATCKKCGAEANFEQHWSSPAMPKRSSAKATPQPAPVSAPT